MTDKHCTKCNRLLLNATAARRGDGVRDVFPHVKIHRFKPYCDECGTPADLNEGEMILYNHLSQRPAQAMINWIMAIIAIFLASAVAWGVLTRMGQ